MKISMDVDGDGEEDLKLELNKSIGKKVVLVVAALVSLCLGGNFHVL